MIELLAVPALITLGAAGLELAAKFDLVPTMARVRAFGSEFTADVLKDNGDGTFLMKSKQATARTAVGTQFTAKSSEVIEMAAAEMPAARLAAGTPIAEGFTLIGDEQPIGGDCQAALDKAMAAERETLPTPASIIASFRKDSGIVTKGASQAAQAPASGSKALSTSGVSVPPGPTAAPSAPNPGSIPMTHLAEKLKALATGTSGFATALEAKIDDALAKHSVAQSTIVQQVDDAMAKVDAITADAKAGVDAITAELAKVTN